MPKTLKNTYKEIPTVDKQYTCDGANEPPPLTWTKAFPSETKSLVLIMCDPDASEAPFFHWVIQYLPPTTKAINPQTLKKAKFGLNSADSTAYFGPCPPKDDPTPHRYYINLYALSESYESMSPIQAPEFLHKIRHNVLEKRTLFLQKYKRKLSHA